jgi:CRP-like cAMP-binding protein
MRTGRFWRGRLPTPSVGPRHDLINAGDRPDNVHLILEGFACRYKLLPNGERQIMAYLVPGDICWGGRPPNGIAVPE